MKTHPIPFAAPTPSAFRPSAGVRRRASSAAAGLRAPPDRRDCQHTRRRTLLLRDIHPDDVDALRRGFATLTPEEIRLRFLHPLTDLPEQMATVLRHRHGMRWRSCCFDPETPANRRSVPWRAPIDPATLAAEFVRIVQHVRRSGPCTPLMRRLIGRAGNAAVEIWGDVLGENGAMLSSATISVSNATRHFTIPASSA
jgi:acetyltransferase